MRKLVVAFQLLLCCGLGHTQQLGDLKYTTNEFPPYAMMQGGTLTGASVELLRAVWKSMGVDPQPIGLAPFTRLLSDAQKIPNAVIFSVTRSTEREHAFKWAGPIQHTKVVLIGRAEKQPPKTLADAADKSIGVVRGDIAESILLNKQHPVDKTMQVSGVDQLVQMLDANRIEFACVNLETFLRTVARLGGNKKDYREALLVFEASAYFAFNLDVDDKIVSRFQKALDALEPTRRKILDAYGVSP